MNNTTIFIIIAIFVMILLVKMFTIRKSNLEHLTTQSDEAIQNLASLYNKDQLTIGNLTVMQEIKSENIDTAKAKIGNFDTNARIKTNKVQLGDKWLLAGDADSQANDDWLRLLRADGTPTYYGGLAAGRLYDARVGDLSTAFANVTNSVNSVSGRLARISGDKGGFKCADGWDVPGTPVQANDLNDCAGKCGSTAMCVMYSSNERKCYCKTVMGLNPNPDGNWTARLMV